MDCPRCSNDVARGSRACPTCGFDLLAKPAPGAAPAGGAPDPHDPTHAEGWKRAGRGLRMFVLADIAQTVGVALVLIPALTGALESLTVFAVLMGAVVVATGGLKVVGFHRFRQVPARSGAADQANRVMWIALAGAALQLAVIGVTTAAVNSGMGFGPPSKFWTALQSPLQWGSAICALAVPVGVAQACGSIASCANEQALRRHTWLVTLLLVVAIAVGVLLVLTVGGDPSGSIVVGLVSVAWAIFFWITTWRTSSVAARFGVMQAKAVAAF